MVINCNLIQTPTSGLQRRHWSNSRPTNKVSRTANAVAALGVERSPLVYNGQAR